MIEQEMDMKEFMLLNLVEIDEWLKTIIMSRHNYGRIK